MQAVFQERPAVTFEALGRDPYCRTAEMGNAAASSLDEMFGRQFADDQVIRANKRCLQSWDGAIH
jgi:hypothetical protein